MNKKADLKQTIAYLQSRRSGVEWSIGKTEEEQRAYITRVSHDIETHQADLYRIEEAEKQLKELEKQRKAQAKKEVWK